MTTLRRPPALGHACLACGAPLSASARFCPRCGHAVEGREAPGVSAGWARRLRRRRALIVAGGLVAVAALVATATVTLLGSGGEQAIGPTIPVPAAVTPDAGIVAAIQPVLQAMPALVGDTDREKVRSILGTPDAFEVSFELDEGGRSDRPLRYETWYYFELQAAFEFVDGDILSNMPVDDVDPLAILPRQYTPELFRRDMTIDDVKKLVAAPDALVRIDVPAELGVTLSAYYGEQLIVAFDDGGLALVETLPLQAGGAE